MTPQDETDFRIALEELEATWGTIRSKTFEVYFKILSDLSLEVIQAAILYILGTRTLTGSFPVPAEIRAAALACNQINELTAAEAWIEVQAQILRCAGRTELPQFSTNRVRQACETLGGVNTIWRAGLEQEGMYRAQFTKAYDGMSEKQHKIDMIGRDEATKVLHGLYAQIDARKVAGDHDIKNTKS